MHQDLEALHRRYSELTETANQGHIAISDVHEILAGLFSVDGTGAVWRVTADGTFTREEFAGADPIPTDPTHFVDPATTYSNPETGEYNIPRPALEPAEAGLITNPFDMTNQPTPAAPGGFGAPPPPPAAPPAGGFGAPAPGAQAGPVYTGQPLAPSAAEQPAPGGFGAPAAAAGGFGNPTPPPPPGPGPVAGEPIPADHIHVPGSDLATPPTIRRNFDDYQARSLNEPENRRSLVEKITSSRVWGAARTHKALAVILALAAVFLVQRFVFSGDDGDKIPTGKPTPAPTDSYNGDQLPADGDDKNAGKKANTGKAKPKNAAGPAAGRITKVVADLSSGKPARLNVLTPGKDDPKRISAVAGLFSASAKAGFTIAPAQVKGTGDTRTQTWTLMHKRTPVAAMDVVWVRHDGKWMLQELPLPTP